VVLEITPRAEQHIDPRLTRRLVELELRDIELPPRPGDPHPAITPSVFFRVLVPDSEALRIELWERGSFYGARGVSVEGPRQVRARRLALGAAELVRRLRARRLAEARRLEAEEARLATERRERELWQRHDTLAVGAGLGTALVGPGDLWLAGPALSAELRLESGGRLDLGARWLFGQSPELDSSASWLEMSVAPSTLVRPSPALDLAIGLHAAVASVRLAGAAGVDGIDGERDTWSARAGVHLRAEPKIDRATRLSFGPELGALLRPIPARDAGEDRRLGGLWLGLTLGVSLDPRGRL
jgi:hypothetical protein